MPVSILTRTPFLIGAALLENGRDYNSAVLLDRKGSVLNIYRKKYLIPFSEYLPLKGYLNFLRDTFHFNIYDFRPGMGPGIFTLSTQGQTAPFPIKGGIVICSEEAYPHLFRSLKNHKAGFVMTLLNDGWFNQEAALILHAQNAIMRAVENSIPIVRVANTGWSCLIDQHGTVTSLLKDQPLLNTAAYGVFPVPLVYRETIYGRWGDIFAVLCVCFVIINHFANLWRGIRTWTRG